LTSLVKQIDERIAKDHKLKAFVVVLTDDHAKTSAKLKALATEAKIKDVPLTLIEGAKGPADYQIAKDADVTVMMWKGGKVKINRAFAKGRMTEDEVKTIVSDIPKLLSD
jgi:hypothetical protein